MNHLLHLLHYWLLGAVLTIAVVLFGFLFTAGQALFYYLLQTLQGGQMIGSIYLPLWTLAAFFCVLCFLPDMWHNLKKGRDWFIGRYYDHKYRSYKG